MATIRVFDSKGVKELQCFDVIDNVKYLPVEDLREPESEPEDED